MIVIILIAGSVFLGGAMTCYIFLGWRNTLGEFQYGFEKRYSSARIAKPSFNSKKKNGSALSAAAPAKRIILF